MIYLDTNAFIFVNINPINDPKNKEANKVLKKYLGKRFVTSTLTWDEYVHVTKKLLGKKESIIKGKEFLDSPIELIPPDKKTLEIAQTQLKYLSPRDAIHTATMIQHKIKEIISDDKDFDKIKEIKRIKIE